MIHAILQAPYRHVCLLAQNDACDFRHTSWAFLLVGRQCARIVTSTTTRQTTGAWAPKQKQGCGVFSGAHHTHFP